MKFISLNIFVLFLAFPAIAEKNDVIDLGGLDVKGEIRQPPVRFYQPKTVPLNLIKSVSEMNYKSFEEELTRPLRKEQKFSSEKSNQKQKEIK